LHMNSGDEYYDNVIKEQYKYIIDSIKDGRVFGEKIDFTNYAQVVVAAYYFGNAKRFFENDFLTQTLKKVTQDEG
jgi:hypothetical protein